MQNLVKRATQYGCGCGKKGKGKATTGAAAQPSFRANYSNGQSSKVFSGPSAKTQAEASVARAGGGSVTRA